MKSRDHFLKIFRNLKDKGKLTSPRGLKVLEIENYMYTLPPRVRFANFKARKLNVNYIKEEFLWYLRANKYDQSIVRHAKMWEKCVNEDGTINSNYGQYIFKQENWLNLISELATDKDSRRASIAILNNKHLTMKTNDVCCTYAINFRIRDNKLNMTVQMRSQDAWFGMGNDVPAFSFVHEMLFVSLKENYYSDLEMGDFTCFVNSFHIYERHFKAFDKLLENPEFEEIEVPEIKNYMETLYLIIGKKLDNEEYQFTKWLRSTK